MTFIKSRKIFEAKKLRTMKEFIDKFCSDYNIKDYKILDDFSVDVNDGVNISDEYKNYDSGLRNSRLTELPFKFNKVNGGFNMSGNLITSLKNCPNEVNGFFDCSDNEIESLEGSPSIVNGWYYCNQNSKLQSLKGCTQIVHGFDCSDCKNLESFIGGPVEITQDDYIASNLDSINSLKGLPDEIFGEINLSVCVNIKNLEYLPSEIKGDLRLYKSSITKFDSISNIDGMIDLDDSSLTTFDDIYLYDDKNRFSIDGSILDLYLRRNYKRMYDNLCMDDEKLIKNDFIRAWQKFDPIYSFDRKEYNEEKLEELFSEYAKSIKRHPL